MQYLLTKEELDKLDGSSKIKEVCEDYRTRFLSAMVANLPRAGSLTHMLNVEEIRAAIRMADEQAPIFPDKHA